MPLQWTLAEKSTQASADEAMAKIERSDDLVKCIVMIDSLGQVIWLMVFKMSFQGRTIKVSI